KFESYFKGKGIPVKESEKKPGKKELISSGKMIEKTIDSGKSKILVVGTSEITSSGFIRFARSAMGNKNQYNSQDYSNDHFLHSMMDYMTGNSYVTTMKRKQLEYNPLDATSPTERIVYKVINIAGVPHLILLIGLFVWIRRGSRKKALMKEFSK
ncbi:MAG: hypothetical protein GY754_07165, partial [bacterium]|nr:hypothetical protein [bacterium]